jgi:flagellar M-ring protein FliF
MAQVRTLLQNMTPKGRLVLGGSIAAIALLAVMMMRIASQPSYSTLLTGLDPAQTGKITSALDTKGVKYEIQNNGTALAVDKSQVAQARIALASQGLPQTAQPGMELMDKQKLGASDFQQQVTYQRALEGQLAQTIGQIDGVGGAQVQLVLPQDQLFDNQSSQAKAAVMLSGAGTNLQPGAVRGIAQLVSGSVKGLSPNSVSITDSTGALLWPTSQGGATDGQMAATMKQAAEARFAQQEESNLNAMLAQTLGPGQAQVQVSADLNMNQASQDQLQYDKKGVPLQQQNEQETLKGGGGAGGGGAAGAASNTIPSFAAAGGGGSSNYNRKSSNTQFGVNKKITHTKFAPGAVNKMSVAVLLNKTVPPAEVAAVRQVVNSAAGITPARGDTLSVAQVAFAKPPAAKPASPVTNVIGFAKYIAAGLALLAFLFFVTRHLRRREDQRLLGEPVWLREIEAPTTVGELERGVSGAGGDLVRSAASRAPRPVNPVRGEIEELIDKEPDRVAQQVRAWMNED